MEALPRVITKLGQLLVGEYKLQKGVKGEIVFLQAELQSMKGALEKVSSQPLDQLDIQDKIWASDLRELSYDIEDSIDMFMVRCKGNNSVTLHGIRKFMDRSVGLFRKAKIRHGIANEIKDIKSRVVEVHERRHRYEVDLGVDKPATATMLDPRLFAQYTEAKELVGVDETRDELIKILMEESAVPLQQGKIVSIVGFGGLGKTTLAKAVYEKIKGLFDCCAFVSVSQTPDFKKLFKGLLCELGKSTNEETRDERQLIDVLREFLRMKRYLIVIDDIWDISVWKVIRCALPDNDVGSIVITTTRNVDVAEKAGGAYKLKPLRENHSRKLFYRRVFGNENNDNAEGIEKCPDKELAEVSDRVLKKCAGVPLAIITMASLLASKARNKMDWYEVYHSIGSGLEHNLDVENMRKILSFSYYNMPSHLRTCLLYLSMFPEDYVIGKDRLIWMWIAEGFIQYEKQGKRLFELGESYFNELRDRSMIQPVYDHRDMVYACRVHDMVLDLICSLSSEANFATILDGKIQVFTSRKIRRLSIQDGNEDDSVTLAPSRLQQVRFLGLNHTRITRLPEEIGNLQFLQILDVKGNNISCLPSNVVQLKQLMCLKIDSSTIVPSSIGRLTSLEELSILRIGESNMDILEEMGQLTELRVLHIALDEWNDKLVECLCNLQKIQNLTIRIKNPPVSNISGLDAWVAPRCLRSMDTYDGCCFLTVPAWMNPSHLPCLSSLCIKVREVQQRDLDNLGNLHALCQLVLIVDHMKLGILGEFVIGAGSFPCLVRCVLSGFARPIVFKQGAMPKLRHLEFSIFLVRGTIEVVGNNDGVGLDFGLCLLPSLQYIEAWLFEECASKEQKEELKELLWHAVKIHPNHPKLFVFVDGKIHPNPANNHGV